MNYLKKLTILSACIAVFLLAISYTTIALISGEINVISAKWWWRTLFAVLMLGSIAFSVYAAIVIEDTLQEQSDLLIEKNEDENE